MKRKKILLTTFLFLKLFYLGLTNHHSRTLQPEKIYLQNTGECTPASCLSCRTDGTQKWCERCGNGKILLSTGKKKYCSSKDINIKNCFSTQENEISNPDRCGKCKRGYYLKSPKKCVFINFPNCDFPVKEGNIFKCFGCEKRYLKDDYSGCGGKENFPKNCFFGDKESSMSCRMCDVGFRLVEKRNSTSGEKVKICVENSIIGCKKLQNEKCVECNFDKGFYSVDSFLDKRGNMYQMCEFYSKTILNIFFVLIFLIIISQ